MANDIASENCANLGRAAASVGRRCSCSSVWRTSSTPEGWAGPFQASRTGEEHSVQTFVIRREGVFVLRRPPPPSWTAGMQNLMRIARVVSALADTPVRAPKLLAVCEDHDILGGGHRWATGYLGRRIVRYRTAWHDRPVREIPGFESTVHRLLESMPLSRDGAA